MGNQDDGRAAHLLLELLSNLCVGFCIHRRKRVIKDHHRRILGQHPRNGNTLLLTAGEGDTPLADHRFIPIGKAFDGFIHTGGTSCLAHIFHHPLAVLFRAGNADIFPYRSGKQEWLLQNDGHIFAQMCAADLIDVHAADGDSAAALLQIVQTIEQMHQRRFSAAGSSQNGKGLACWNGEGNIVQHRLLVFIAEGHMLKADVTVHRRGQRLRRVLLRLSVQDIADTADRNAGFAHLCQNFSQRTHRPVEGCIIRNKRQKFTQRDFAVDCADGSDCNDRQHLQSGDQVTGAPIGGHHMSQANPKLRKGIVLFVKAFDFKILPSKCTDHPHTGQVFLYRRRQFSFGDVGVHKAVGDLPLKIEGVKNDDWDKNHRNQRNLYIHRKHDAHSHHNQKDDTEYFYHLCTDKVADDLDVGGAALDNLAGLMRGMPGKRQLLDMPEQFVTQRLDRALGGFSCVEAGKKAEYAGQHRCHQHCGSCKQQDTFDIALHQTVQTQSLKPSWHLPAADNRIYGHADNLWGQRVTRGIEHRANQSQCKQPQTATYKAKHQLYRIFSFILLQTNHSPFDNSFSPLQAFFSLPPFLLSQTDNEHSFPRVRSYLLKQK